VRTVPEGEKEEIRLIFAVVEASFKYVVTHVFVYEADAPIN
jgi:hypothetical protein